MYLLSGWGIFFTPAFEKKFPKFGRNFQACIPV